MYMTEWHPPPIPSLPSNHQYNLQSFLQCNHIWYEHQSTSDMSTKFPTFRWYGGTLWWPFHQWMWSWIGFTHFFFYLWNSVRDNIYQNNPQIFLELKRVIADQIRSVRKQESVRINHNFARHILVCISLNGDKKKTVGYSHLKLYG